MRIVSLLPAATEIAAALGLIEQIVGISHECDYPEAVNALPRVLRSPIFEANLSSAEIDRRVRKSLKAGKSLYEIDESLLRSLEPDLILTQSLCDVCAIGYPTVAALAHTLASSPRLLTLEPRQLSDLYANIREIADVTGVQTQGENVIAVLEKRVRTVTKRGNADTKKPRVVLLEWLDPPFVAGHWNPELVALAGGECLFGTRGHPSVTKSLSEIIAANPDVIVIASCGQSIKRIFEDMPALVQRPDWAELDAVQNGQIYVIDGSHYFNRSGPRLIDSLELLSAILHPGKGSHSVTEGRVFQIEAIISEA